MIASSAASLGWLLVMPLVRPSKGFPAAQSGMTDTVAAMAGALSGAHLGVAAIPGHLVQLLEDGEKGRGYIERLAGELYDRSILVDS